MKIPVQPKVEKDYPWIEEVRIDREVKGIVCKICRIKANFRSYDGIQQRRRNNGKFVTVPFTKMGYFYEQARVHELELFLLLTLLCIGKKFVKEQCQYQQQHTLNFIFLVKLNKQKNIM